MSHDGIVYLDAADDGRAMIVGPNEAIPERTVLCARRLVEVIAPYAYSRMCIVPLADTGHPEVSPRCPVHGTRLLP